MLQTLIIVLLAVLLFSIFIALQTLAYRIIVKSALKKHIVPELQQSGLLFIDYNWPGLLSNGNFKPDDIELTWGNKNGSVSNSFYVYIDYKKLNNTKRVTARINTRFLFIKNVAYSSNF